MQEGLHLKDCFRMLLAVLKPDQKLCALCLDKIAQRFNQAFGRIGNRHPWIA